MSKLFELLKRVNVSKVLSTAEKAIYAASAINSTLEYENKDKVDKAIGKASTAVHVGKTVASVFKSSA